MIIDIPDLVCIAIVAFSAFVLWGVVGFACALLFYSKDEDPTCWQCIKAGPFMLLFYLAHKIGEDE